MTVPFKPSTNGCVERMNRTLLQLLRGYDLRNQDEWEVHLPHILHAYNTSPHTSLGGRSPYEVLVGQLPTTPLDILLHSDDNHIGPIVQGKLLLEEQRISNKVFSEVGGNPFQIRQPNFSKGKLDPRKEGGVIQSAEDDSSLGKMMSGETIRVPHQNFSFHILDFKSNFIYF